MSDQQNSAHQQPLISEEIRQQMPAHLDASKQAIAELSEEQLESVTGGASNGSLRGKLRSFSARNNHQR